ncbi:hypothetical protein ABTE37_19735, partial [Acinetobacter baumannii]
AAVWSLVRIIGPVVAGIRSSLAASAANARGEALAIEERDLPLAIVGLLTLVLLIPIGWLLWDTIATGPIAGAAVPLIIGGILFVIVI